MRLKLSLQSGGGIEDIVVTIDAGARVGELAGRLARSMPTGAAVHREGSPLTIRVRPGQAGERVVAPTLTMSDAGIRSGDTIALTSATAASTTSRATAATLTVVSGEDAGKSFPLAYGTSVVGRDRDCDVRLTDGMVSKRHARVVVTDMAELIDDNSANGTFVNGVQVQRAAVHPGDRIIIGSSEVAISVHAVAAGVPVVGGSSVHFNRSPRLDPTFEGVELSAPELPSEPTPQRFPWLTVLSPLLMGVVLWAITRSLLSMLFIGLSPIMMAGAYFEGKRSSKHAQRESAEQFRRGLSQLSVDLQHACEAEREGRRREHPSTAEVLEAATLLGPLLWARRPEHDRFGQVRLGLGPMPSRNTVRTTEVRGRPELLRELRDVIGEFAVVDRVPVVADLAGCGNIGVAGPVVAGHPIAAGVVAQLVGLHSPAELVLGAITTAGSVPRWAWLKWLPHAGSEYSPLPCEHLADNGPAASVLISELEDLIRARSEGKRSDEGPMLPLVVVLVEDDAAEERPRLVQVAERGPTVGVHLVWVAPSRDRVPAACRTYVEIDPEQVDGRVGEVRSGRDVRPVELEPISADAAMALANGLSPVVDAGALLESDSDLPTSVPFLMLAGPELAESPHEVVERWRGSRSLPEADAERLVRDNSLRALVGQAIADRYYLDLRSHGPHALVGGTTGAGKSEFLQTWILGLATTYSPARVNFLFVDYKGGTAFAECEELPHCVGIVTDLTPHLVRRALRSFRAEVTRREHILNRAKAKDLLEMERRRDPNTPPSLVIIVDEFAALVAEVPEFVDGVVDVAQRGRSLGLHLILATQRPAGVIKENLRANTNLRVALRMADADDSTDVVGSPVAATFDPAIPGRATAKTGAGRISSFQTAYVGGRTSTEPPPATIEVRAHPFGVGAWWDDPMEGVVAEVNEGPTDIRRIVDTIVEANGATGLAPSRKPWLEELAPIYRLEDLPTERTDERLVYGVVDLPDQQDQRVMAFEPDRDGNMAVFGTSGSGKSTFLRSIVAAAGLAPARGGPCHVYGLDFGTRGLAMIEDLPHVGAVINGDDHERILRLLRTLRASIDARAARYAAASAATIVEYRHRTGNADEPRILLLVDNFAAFRQMYEIGQRSGPFELLEGIAADGRSVGVHLIASADQANAFPTGLASVIQTSLALRLASDMDMAQLDVPSDVFSETTPPGRGYQDDSDIQVAVLGGDANVAKQAEAMARFADAMRHEGILEAPPVARLATRIPSSTVELVPGQAPVLGVWDETLEPITFEPSGIFVVAGPPRSGKTATVISLLESVSRVSPETTAVLFGPRKSQLAALGGWQAHVSDPDEAAEYAERLTKSIEESSLDVAGLVVVVESVGDFLGSTADEELQALLRACRAESHLAIVEGETATFNGNWGLMSVVKLDRTGIVLQPDDGDGDFVLGTDFPRSKRVDFPEGRGYYARGGHVYRVQVLEPGPNVWSHG